MIPDPPTAEAHLGEGGPGGPARDSSHGPSRAGHLCVCGQPIEADVWDMTVFATELSVAYITCLWAGYL
jgi:hypothetical protein